MLCLHQKLPHGCQGYGGQRDEKSCQGIESIFQLPERAPDFWGIGKIEMNCDPMLAPCGLECGHCVHFLAHKNSAAMEKIERWSANLKIPSEEMLCAGCRAQGGRIPFQKHLFGSDHRCAIYACSQREGVDYCGTCSRFPCGKRHPYIEKSKGLAQETRAFLCA